MAQFESPFVVQLVGLVTLGSPILMVIEFAEHGSLKSFLEKRETDERLRLLWAGDIAEGMAHVHGKGFLHRDLATRNVLVGSDMRCKVSDFGLAREVDEDDAYYRSRGGQVGEGKGELGEEKGVALPSRRVSINVLASGLSLLASYPLPLSLPPLVFRSFSSLSDGQRPRRLKSANLMKRRTRGALASRSTSCGPRRHCRTAT